VEIFCKSAHYVYVAGNLLILHKSNLGENIGYTFPKLTGKVTPLRGFFNIVDTVYYLENGLLLNPQIITRLSEQLSSSPKYLVSIGAEGRRPPPEGANNIGCGRIWRIVN